MASALLLSALAAIWTAVAAGVTVVAPEAVGMSASRLAQLDDFYADRVQMGEMAGIVTLVARHGKVVHLSAMGYADIGKKKKMEKDTIFRIYSMSKPITSTALMMLYEKGRFQLNDPLSKYIPEFSALRVLRHPDAALDETVPPTRAPTIQDALRHTAGFTHGASMDAYDQQYSAKNVFGLDISLADEITKLAGIPLRYQPGTRFVYSVAPDVQARLVEILSGKPFDAFLDERVFKPLGMKDAGFSVPAGKADRLATVYWAKDGRLTPLDDAHGHPEGSILFEPWMVNSYGAKHVRMGGSFGLVSTAEDYWRFAQMLLNTGRFGGARILSPQIVHYMERDQLAGIGVEQPNVLKPGMGFGIGFAVVKEPAAAGFLSSDGSLYWAGAANTVFLIDPREDMVVIALSQMMGGSEASELLPRLCALVYAALRD